MKKVQFIIISEFFLYGTASLFLYGRIEFGDNSLTHILLLGLPFIISIILFIISKKFSSHISQYFIQHSRHLAFPAWLMLLIVVMGFITPSEYWGIYFGYFERIRIFFAIIGTIPAQLLIPILLKNIDWKDQSLFRSIILSFLGLISLGAIIWISGFGITPETWFWNGPGIPLTSLQWLEVLFITSFFAWIFLFTVNKHPKYFWLVDLVIAFCLFFLTAWVWTHTPLIKHFFILQPQAPAFQPFPYSDARIYDTQAWSLLAGNHVNVDLRNTTIDNIYIYFSKPFYIAFLALLHRLIGDNYALMSYINAIILASAAPALYWFGKTFHSRFLGLAMVLILMLRQKNAIEIGHRIASINPLLLVTETLCLMFIIFICWIGFLWIRKNKLDLRLALLIGGGWAVLSLIRVNGLGIFPAFIISAFFVSTKNLKLFWKNIGVLLIGWVIVFSPWLVTGRDINGVPLLFLSSANFTKFWAPSTKTASLPDLLSNQGPILSELDKPFLEKFPGFFYNHTLHNGVTAFLSLPDSLFSDDQSLVKLSQRPYWKTSDTWKGTFPWTQIPILFINLFLIAVGIGWSWNRWKIAGLFPLIIFWNYVFTLGLSRVSGTRYIVPVDWVLFLYYICGITTLLRVCGRGLSIVSEEFHNQPLPTIIRTQKKQIEIAFSIICVILLALPVPMSYTGALKIFDACKEQAIVNQKIQINNEENLLFGKILYPIYRQGHMDFTLMGCNQYIEFSITNLDNIPYGKNVVLVTSKDNMVLHSIYEWSDNKLISFWNR